MKRKTEYKAKPHIFGRKFQLNLKIKTGNLKYFFFFFFFQIVNKTELWRFNHLLNIVNF